MTPIAGAQDADFIITMLSDDTAVESVLLDPETGCINSAKAGALVIDSSTVSPALSRTLNIQFSQRGIGMVDPPVTGGVHKAERGELTFMVGGDRQDFDRARFLLDVMGSRVIYVGRSGSGSTVKLANNTTTALNLVAWIEGLSILESSGISPDVFWEVTTGGGASSGISLSKKEKILRRQFEPNFRMQLMLKDLRLAENLAMHLGLPLPALALASNMVQISCNTGLGDCDMAALYAIYRNWYSVEK